MIKRIFMFVLACVFVFTAVGCKSKDGGSQAQDMTLQEIMDKLNEGTSFGSGDLISAEVTQEAFESEIFTEYIEGSEALMCGPVIGSIPYSVDLLRVPEGTDVKKTAEDIEKNADPRKWICVEAEKVTVKYSGNIIMLALTDEESAKIISDNFDKLFS